MIHVVAATEFAVRYIQKLGTPGQRAKRVPGLDVRDRVVGVAIGEAKLHRHSALGLGSQDKQQLLQIGAVVLGVAIGDGRGASAADRVSGGAAVLPAEAYRGGIIMQFGEAHGELLPHREYHFGEQRAAIGVKQPVQRPADAVIAKMTHLSG